ncbi:reverse transcriptase [Tanacetum coccineum]|uniref:Reverse transcriptase n=1 Tax=Tanacetum coccineum TaxID=301880 RepID=A0ABQ5H260_9ASTR
MVGTRNTNNTIEPSPNLEAMQMSINTLSTTVLEMKSAMVEITESMKGFLVQQNLVVSDLKRLKNVKGTSHNNNGRTTNHQYGRMTKIEFPKFSGDDVKRWLYRCNQFFKIDRVDDGEKVGLASMHMYDKALTWHQQFCKKYGEANPWDLYEKRGAQKPRCSKQTLVVLKSRYGPVLSTPKVVTTSNVYRNVNNVTKPNTMLALPSTSYNSSKPNDPYRKQLTQKELEHKRANHLCFYCDQKYAPGHKCSGQLHSLDVIVDCEEENEENIKHGVELNEGGQSCQLGEEVDNETEMSPRISIHALSRITNHQTMRVGGYVGKQVIHIFIDSGSTHNFLDLQKSKRLGCQAQRICPMQVEVANGNSLTSHSVCNKFKWTLQGIDFEADVLILPLGGCEMVLGIQ